MVYAKKITTVPDEYQGESFTRSLSKASLAIWDTNETASYEMVNGSGIILSSGDLVKSGDNLSMTLTIPKEDTVNLKGKMKVIVNLIDTIDTTFCDVIAEYTFSYVDRKA